MISKIATTLEDSFERKLFHAALRNLDDSDNPLRFNNFCYAIRELTRHYLHRLSPDENILACKWYVNKTEKENGITRKQRAIYAVQGGLENSYVKDTLKIEVDEIHENLVKAINRLSKFTHIEQDCFSLTDYEVDTRVKETLEAISSFVDLIDNCKELIINELLEEIDKAIIEESLRETIQALDELASHHYIDEIYTDIIEVTCISHEFVNFTAKGTISCELQWGSNSDVRNGDGAVSSTSFQFKCNLFSPVYEPSEVQAIEDSFGVDTEEWQGLKYGLDEQL